ncbi:uncharacterized protein LOC123879786 [Maniola jurtina]|uniref:uncharacterized protein LOC123879786 n=1 Tax=Maniola jurtina TaxID=191418 RepID=UPI001E68BC9F|nr:uncharacterized protein LOC123879786 [Maniola jurtina]
MFGQQQSPAQPSPADHKAAAELSRIAPEKQDGLAAVTISSRIPEFWMDKPKLWFAQFEATIYGQKLGDAAKQNLVVTKLTKGAIEQISDLILEPPENNKYEALKERLLQVFEETKERQFRQLLSEMELGSQKPSQLLRRMKDLAKGKIAEESLRMLWIGHLPSSVRAVLAVTDVDLNALAVVADKIMETTKPIEVSEIQSDNAQEPDLATQVAKLTLKVEAMERGRTGRRDGSYRRTSSAARFRDRTPRSRSKSRSRKSPEWLCFYHFKFGAKANKCVDPCNWKKNTPEN